MKVYFNSRDEFYKKPFGAVKTGTTVTFRVRVSEKIKGIKCYMAMWKQDTKLPDVIMEKEREEENGDTIYFAKFKTPSEETVLWYHFVFESFDEKFYYSNNDLQSGGEGVLVDNSPKSFQLTVYKSDIAPNWFKEGIAYQIFPDRFNRGSDYESRKSDTIKKIEGKNHGKKFIDDWYRVPQYERDNNGNVVNYDFYGGTFKGIEEKLPYLKSLGVSMIYLNPIFEARSNHRYDTGNYMIIDSLLGDDESFKLLVKAAKKEGIGIILDGVFSHQGADSIYFNKYNNYDVVGAFNSKDSRYYDWYSFNQWPNEYECWWGVKDLPNVKEMNEDYLNYICRDKNSV
ncbi:MAG: glycoside hydrolase family 13 protein, partial [Lachnospiraceae bacterium]|nr:glycoside hydrolase family 13 protein [Lachnospiraceae bacterium]